MKIKILSISLLFICFSKAIAQIGINTPSPKATLEIVGKPDDVTVVDGLLIPRINGNDLFKKNNAYGTDQTGTLIYVTAAATGASLSGDTIDVIEAGFYRHNGAKWVSFKQTAWNTNGNSNSNIDGGSNKFIGTNAGGGILKFKVEGIDSGYISYDGTAMGYNTSINTTDKTAFGANALTVTTATSNTAFGENSLRYTTTGNFNSGVGQNSLLNNTTGGNNTAAGYNALSNNITGNNNIGIGYEANVTNPDQNNSIAIGAYATVATSNSMVLGGTGAYAVNVGINTTTPKSKLHVAGDGINNPVLIENLITNNTANNIVVSNNNGILQTRELNTLVPSMQSGSILTTNVDCRATSTSTSSNCLLNTFTVKADRKSLAIIHLSINVNNYNVNSGGANVSTINPIYFGINLYQGSVFLRSINDTAYYPYGTDVKKIVLEIPITLVTGTYTFRVDGFTNYNGNTTLSRFLSGSTYSVTLIPME